MIVHVRDAEAQARAAHYLRTLLDAVERGEVMYVGATAMLTLEGAKAHGCCALDLNERIETMGLGEFFLVLGKLRDFYLTAEDELRHGQDESEP